MDGIKIGLAATAWLVSFCLNTAWADDLDQAKIEGSHFIQHRFAIRSDGTVFSHLKKKAVPGFGEVDPAPEYYQFDGFRSDVIEEVPTHADNLNGITWKGKIIVNFAASRTSLAGGNDLKSEKICWKPWEDVPKWPDALPYDMTWSLQHIHGDWHVSRENSRHWFEWAFGGEDATAPDSQETVQVSSFVPCK